MDFSEEYLGAAWSGCLLLKREIYMVKRKYIISCGFFKWSAIVLPMEVKSIAGQCYMWPSIGEFDDGIPSITWLSGNMMELARHIPTEIVPPCCLPSELLGKSCALRVTGDDQEILKPAFRNLVVTKYCLDLVYWFMVILLLHLFII